MNELLPGETGSQIAQVLEISEDTAERVLAAAHNGELTELHLLWKQIILRAAEGNRTAQYLAPIVLHFHNDMQRRSAPEQISPQENWEPPQAAMRRGRDMLAAATPYAVQALVEVAADRRNRAADRTRAAELILKFSSRLEEENYWNDRKTVNAVPELPSAARQSAGDIVRQKLAALRKD